MINIGGTFKNVTDNYVLVGGVWKTIAEQKLMVSAAWKTTGDATPDFTYVNSDDPNGASTNRVACTDTSVGAVSWYWEAIGKTSVPQNSTAQNPSFVIDSSAGGTCDIKLTVNGGPSVTKTLTMYAASYLTGLVSWWKGEDNANDSWGTNHGSLWAGSTPPLPYGPGEVNRAFQFANPGTAQKNWVDVPNNASLNVGQISLEAWINRDVVWSTWDPIIKKKTYSLEFVGGNLSLWLSISGGWKQSALYAISLLTLYHVIVTYDGTSIILYINGSPQGSATNAPGAIDVDATTSLQIAQDPSNPGARMYGGMIDEASLWSRGLTAAEVLAIYNRGVLGK